MHEWHLSQKQKIWYGQGVTHEQWMYQENATAWRRNAILITQKIWNLIQSGREEGRDAETCMYQDAVISSGQQEEKRPDTCTCHHARITLQQKNYLVYIELHRNTSFEFLYISDCFHCLRHSPSPGRKPTERTSNQAIPQSHSSNWYPSKYTLMRTGSCELSCLRAGNHNVP